MKKFLSLIATFVLPLSPVQGMATTPARHNANPSFTEQAMAARGDVFTEDPLTQEPAVLTEQAAITARRQKIRIMPAVNQPLEIALANRLETAINNSPHRELDLLLESPAFTRKYLGTDLVADFAYFLDYGWSMDGSTIHDPDMFIHRYLDAVLDIENGRTPLLSAEDLLRFRTFFLATFGGRKWVKNGVSLEDHIFPDVNSADGIVHIQDAPWLLDEKESDPAKRKFFAAVSVGERNYLAYRDPDFSKPGIWYRSEGVLDDDSNRLRFLETFSPTSQRASPFLEGKLNEKFNRKYGDQYGEDQLLDTFRDTGFCVRAALSYMHAHHRWDLWYALGPADVDRYSNVPLKTAQFPTVQVIAERVKGSRRGQTFNDAFDFHRNDTGEEFLEKASAFLRTEPSIRDFRFRKRRPNAESLSWDQFRGLKNARIKTRLDERGGLMIGGGRPLVNGENPATTDVPFDSERAKSWAQFGPDHSNEPVELIVKDGVIHQVVFPDSGLTEEFALVWSRRSKRYLSSFWGDLTNAEFNLLTDDMEIHNFHLPSTGMVSIGGRLHWMSFAKEHAGKAVRLFDIRQSEGRSFITAGEVIDQGKVLASKHLRVLYTVAPHSEDSSFQLGRLLDVFEKNGDTMMGPDGRPLFSYILTDITLDSEGGLKFGRFRRRLKTIPKGRVDIKVIDDEKRFVRPRLRGDQTPIWASNGQPVILDLRKVNSKSQLDWPPLMRFYAAPYDDIATSFINRSFTWRILGIPVEIIGGIETSLRDLFHDIPEALKNRVGPRRNMPRRSILNQPA